MSDIPDRAPHDAVMAKPAEIAKVRAWAEQAFAGRRTPPPKADEFLAPASPPFSFTYGGAPSSTALKAWPRTVTEKQDKDRRRITASWADPKTGLRVTAEVSLFKRYPAVDWVLHFENTGSKDTPILQDVNAADLPFATDAATPAVLHRLQGDACGERSFKPCDTELKPGERIDMAPVGGRSSNTSAFPFFNFRQGAQGLIAAIGWSGQWRASFDRPADSPTRFTAGIEKMHLLLHPGERIRTPRILLMRWAGDLADAQNRFRRLVLFNYCPRIAGKPIHLPIALQNYDRYMRRPGWATEQGQLKSARAAAKMGCDAYWFDAGWFVGDFPRGVGNWYCKPAEFPNGLKPLGDECHKLGLKFVLWFEPERVAPGTQIAAEHPQFVLPGANNGLFNLGNPAARRWLTDLLSSRISEYGVDIYRNDFNINPLDYWRAGDAPDRQGMTEIRYVEGHYTMWDELRARHPGLWIDNCASGGRRIDIETLMRSVPLWRSDTCCSPGHAAWDQAQNCAIAQYVPLFTGAAWTPDACTVRSVATGGAICQFGYMDEGFSMSLAKQAIREIKSTRKYWCGDLYPLTRITADLDQTVAWQLHRPDLDEGMILAFRRDQSPYPAVILRPRALDPKKTYKLTLADEARRKTLRTVSGRKLMTTGIELRLPKQGSSLLVFYRPA